MSAKKPPVNYGKQPPPKKLTPEELEKSTERLYTRSMAQIQKKQDEYRESLKYQELHNDISNKKVNPDLSPKEAEAVDHLYRQPMERKEKKKEALEKKYVPPAAQTKTVLPEEQEAIVDRLYTQGMHHKETNIKLSTKRIYGNPEQPKKLDQESLKGAIDQLYTVAIEKKKTADATLDEKYAWKKVGPTKKLSKGECDDLAMRLSTKGGK